MSVEKEERKFGSPDKRKEISFRISLFTLGRKQPSIGKIFGDYFEIYK